MSRIERFTSPSMLLLALLLFPMPWVEVQCPVMTARQPPRTGMTANWPRWLVDPLSIFRNDSISLFTQSGLQASYGGWSAAEPDKTSSEEDVKWTRLKRELEAQPASFPWLALYPVLLLAGVVAGLWMPPGPKRRLTVSSCAALALILALLVLLMGFPLERSWTSIPPEATNTAKPADPDKYRREMRELIRITGWFWMAQTALVGCVMMQFAEWRVSTWITPRAS